VHLLSRLFATLLITLTLGLAACNPSTSDGLAGSGVDTDLEVAPVDEVGADDMAEEASDADEADGSEEMAAEEVGAETSMGAQDASGMEAASGALTDAGVVFVNDPKGDQAAADSGASLDASGDAGTDADGINALSAGDAQALLAAHNRWRANYNSPALSWDTEIAAVAQAWADQLANTGGFEHSGNRNYGENLWAGTAGRFSRDSVVDSWGSEVQFWDLGCTGGLDDCCQGGWQKCGHFTAVVWSTTTRVGCGSAVGANGTEVVVCNYAPPGNFSGVNPFEGNAAPAPAPTQEAPAPTVEVAEPTQAPPEPTQAPIRPTTVPIAPPPAPQPPAEGQKVFSWRTAQNGIGLAIPDEDYAVHEMTVTQPGTITAMAMGVTINHTYVGDLAILLYHPDGTYAILRNQTGGDGGSINDVYGKGGIPVAGLDQFAGKPLAGTWYLVIYDVAAQDTGTLDGTSMYFEFAE